MVEMNRVRRIAISFGISLAVDGLCMAATRFWLWPLIFVGPGFALSWHLVPQTELRRLAPYMTGELTGGPQSWMYFVVVCGTLIDAALLTLPVLLVWRVLAWMFSIPPTSPHRAENDSLIA